MNVNVLELFKFIQWFVFDIDGVLTDGSLLIMPNGVMTRRMNIKDGYALQLAIKKGYRMSIISGGSSVEVKDRLQKLGIVDVHLKVQDKKKLLQELIATYQIEPKQILYMGDDMPDFEVMGIVGLPCCPEDAAREVQDISAYISPYSGGYGCVRDVVEKVLRLHNKWI